ncbi:MAG: flagellar FliJ family protein [Candidatus Sericytochromatia bacterium]|nr:flagellar FliJ family protein [Candidatus Sericytochromatia bacterium]
MKRFSFRYQTLLEVREQAQRREEDKLRRLLAEQAAEAAEIARLEALAEASRQAFAAELAGRLELDHLVTMHGCLDARAQAITDAKRRLEACEARVLNQREVLLVTQQEAEVLRRLKARDFEAWQRSLDRAEAALLDEIATLRHNRRGV